MTATVQSPGSATEDELRDDWRMPSLRATRELARKLGVRRVKRQYPWYVIWAAEGLAPPARKHWDELKLPHLTADGLAEALGESARSARRRDAAKPDASFPDPLPLRKKPKLWRAAQVNAYVAGLPVPSYRAASMASRKSATATPVPSDEKFPSNGHCCRSQLWKDSHRESGRLRGRT